MAALLSTRNSASRYWREGEGGEGHSEGRREGGRRVVHEWAGGGEERENG